MSYRIPKHVREVLDPLAEAVLPIAAWVAHKSSPRLDVFIPPLNALPWRPAEGSPTLSIKAMGVVKFVEWLIDHDAVDEHLAPHWRALRADALAGFQTRGGKNAAAWRAGRHGLNANARFGAFEPDSSNFAFVTVNADGTPKDAVSRKEFYGLCWGPLAASYDANPPTDDASWIAFREKLRADQLPTWPVASAVRSSAFIIQFTIDVLYACLGQKNPAIANKAALWQRGVLTELGENRAPKNRYTTKEAAQAVIDFQKVI